MRIQVLNDLGTPCIVVGRQTANITHHVKTIGPMAAGTVAREKAQQSNEVFRKVLSKKLLQGDGTNLQSFIPQSESVLCERRFEKLHIVACLLSYENREIARQ